jgi:hypothetical protein
MEGVTAMRQRGPNTRCRVGCTLPWDSGLLAGLQQANNNTTSGVMRFLQLEWHNHERARNAWDIERAEMKAKIAKQEGEVRSAKKLNDQLNKHIRMLEQALTSERKKKTEATGEAAADDKKDSKGKKSGLKPTKRAYIAGILMVGIY